jgi:hypothetical protein
MSEAKSMPELEIELRNQKDMLEAVNDSQPKGPTKEQKKLFNQILSKYRAVYAYNRADTDLDTLVRVLKPSGLLRNAIMRIDRWAYYKPGAASDAKLKVWVTEDVRGLFSKSLTNRLISTSRNAWNLVVFVKFIIVGEDGILIEEKDDDNG